MEIGWDLSYTSNVRRGYIVDLFEKHKFLEEFKATHWANGNTPKGISVQAHYLHIKQRYEDFLEGGFKFRSEHPRWAGRSRVVGWRIRDAG